MKDLLKLLDLSREEIVRILDVADQMKYDQKHRLPHPRLQGKTLAMIFEKNPTRTRVSFETGMFQLGGHALFLSGRESQIGRGEPVEDTARVLSRYCDGIMIRTYSQEEVEKLARYADIPVINGLTDFAHPCQVLADLMTIRERKARLEGLKMCFIGDGINDPPALSAADIGIAINSGAAIAREIADVTIKADSLEELVTLKTIANALQHRVSSNYRFVLSFNSTLIVLGALGILQPAASAMLHNLSTIGISLRSMTNLIQKPSSAPQLED